MEETWKRIPEFKKGYEISTTGKVRLIKNSKKLAMYSDAFGYQFVYLKDGDKRVKYRIPHLMGKVFLKTNNLLDYIDGNYTNNNLDNLKETGLKWYNLKSVFSGSSKFIGVYYYEEGNKWKTIPSLGYFNTELEAAEAKYAHN